MYTFVIYKGMYTLLNGAVRGGYRVAGCVLLIHLIFV